MNRTIESWGNPGDLLHAVLEGWVVVEKSDATAGKAQPQRPIESRRAGGVRSIRASRVSVSERHRPAS
jgi:hypothetical protein